MNPDHALRPSSRAWTELLHAEVAYLLNGAGVPVLHIKGPTVAMWLYPDGGRNWGDVDILVSPSRMEEALDVLRRAGLGERFPGVDRSATSDHAVTLARRDPDAGADEVDVHDRFPGVDGDAERTFEEFWRRREPGSLAHTQVWFPDRSTRAILLVLNTARSPRPQAMEDLARLLDDRAGVDWADVLDLAGRVDATSGLRAGLELRSDGRALVSRTALSAVPVSSHWRLVLEDAPRTALRLLEFADVPWPRRPRVLARWLFPPPAVLRMRDPLVGYGPVAVGAAYIHRLADGARDLPQAVRAVRRSHRP